MIDKVNQSCYTKIKKLSNNKTKGLAKMNFTVNKEIGGKKLEFVYEVKKGEKGSLEIGCKVEGYVGTSTKTGMVYGCKLNQDKKAITFSTVKTIAGKKVGGIVIPEEMFVEIKKMQDDFKNEEEAKQEQELNDIKNGKITIEVKFHDGEYLSGHTLHGKQAKLLVELGLARYVDGWGYLVNEGVVKALGETFTYSQAVEFAQPKIEAAEKLVASEKSKVAAKFLEAKETEKKVKLESWMEECNDHNEDCSLDSVTTYAMPNGTVKTERNHTW